MSSSKKRTEKHYVVLVGYNPGIYKNWLTCENEIHGYNNAVYASFDTLEKAQTVYSNFFHEEKICKKDYPCPNCGALTRLSIAVEREELGNHVYKCTAPNCNFWMRARDLMCGCGCGICETITITSGKHVGRKIYICPSDEPCNYLRWVDGPTTSIGDLVARIGHINI